MVGRRVFAIGIVVAAMLLSGPAQLQAEAPVSWTQTDWSEGQYSEITDLNADDSSGELLLQQNPSHMVLAFSPTQLEGIWDMEGYDGKLFLAAATKPLDQDGGDILSYEYATHRWNLEYRVYEQGVVVLRAYNGKLYVPGPDSLGSHDWGNLYIYNGQKWSFLQTIPNGIHVFDSTFYNDKLYVTTGTGVDHESAKVYESGDDGLTWREAFRVSANPQRSCQTLPNDPNCEFRRFYAIGAYDGALYVQADGIQPEGDALFRFDGRRWETIPLPKPSETRVAWGTLETFNHRLYYLNWGTLRIFDGQVWKSVEVPFGGGAGGWISRSLEFYDGRLYGGGQYAFLWVSEDGGETWAWASQLTTQLTDSIESLEVYHGRLYAGTRGARGKVYVSSSALSGSLVSNTHDFGRALSGGRIRWEELLPSPATRINFQLRSALTEAELSEASFLGPDGTTNTYYDRSGTSLNAAHHGHRWIQYKVLFETTDQSLTPLLQSVSIEIN